MTIQRIADNTQAERKNVDYYKVKAERDAVESIGVSLAKAQAVNEKDRIEAEGKVRIVELDAEYEDIIHNQEMTAENRTKTSLYQFDSAEAEIDLHEQQAMADVEIDRVSRMMTAVGQTTLAEIMNAEPEMQQEMLKSLGLKGYLMTDGRNPINLFDTANGLVSQTAMAGQGMTQHM